MDELEFITSPDGPILLLPDGTYKILVEDQDNANLLSLLKFKGAGQQFYDLIANDPNNPKQTPQQKKENFSSIALIWDVVPVSYGPFNTDGTPIASINSIGILTVQSAGQFQITVRFDDALVNSYNKMVASNIGFGKSAKELTNDGISIDAISDPISSYERTFKKVKDTVSDMGSGIIDFAMSNVGYLAKLALGGVEFLNDLVKEIEDAVTALDPVAGKLLKDEINKIKAAVQSNNQTSWISGLIGLPISSIPLIGPGLDIIEKTIRGAITIGSSITGGIVSLASNLVKEALSRINSFLQLDERAKAIAAKILGIDVATIDRAFQAIKEIQRIETALATGDITQITAAVKQTLIASGMFKDEAAIDAKFNSIVSAVVNFVMGNITDLLFGSIKGSVISKEFKMESNTVGILTVINPKELGNNIQITEIEIEDPTIAKDGSNSVDEFEIENIEVIGGGDIDDLSINPGQTVKIKITFKNPKKEEGSVKIDATYNYLGLKPDEQIDAKGVKIPISMIGEGDEESDSLSHVANTPGSNQKEPPKTDLKNAQDLYAKTAENFAKAERAKELAEKAGGQALKDAEAKLEEARKKLEEVKKKLDEQVAAIEKAKKFVEDAQKATFLQNLNKVNYENLPPELQDALNSTGLSIGITDEDMKYYLEIESKIKRVKDLLGTNNPIWKNLKDYQKASLAERLRLAVDIVDNTIDTANRTNQIITDKADPIKGLDFDLSNELQKITNEKKDALFQKLKDNKFIQQIQNGGKDVLEAFGIGVGIWPDYSITEGKKGKDLEDAIKKMNKDWHERIRKFLEQSKVINDLHKKRENIRNQIVKEANKERERQKNRQDSGTANKSPVAGGNKTKNKPKTIKRPKRGDVTDASNKNKIYRINPVDPIVGVRSPGTTNPIQVKELSKEVTVVPVPEMVFYESEFRTHWESMNITPDTIQDIYDNAEEIIKDPILDLKDAIEDGDTGAVKGFTNPNTEPVVDEEETGGTDGTGGIVIQPATGGTGGIRDMRITVPPATGGTGGTGGIVTPPGTGGTGGTGGVNIPEGVTGAREFEEGEEGKDYGTYVIYADETKTKFSVDGQTLETPFLYAIYRYILCSNDTPETSKSRAKANILKFKDELTKKYFIQSSDEYVGDDSCPNDEIQIRLIPSVAPDGTVQLKREASDRKIRTGAIQAENTYIDSSGNIRELPAPPGQGEKVYKWRDEANVQQPVAFVYPEDEESVIVYDPSLFLTTDPQNDTQKSVRERIQYLLQTGGISASRISFDILADGSVVWDGEVKINKKGLTADGKIPINFALTNGNFDCSGLDLTTLENSPRIVYGEFNCSNNKLTTLEKGPKGVVAFIANKNPLGDGTGLKYGPQMIIGWPVGTIIHGQNGYIYSCEDCKLNSFAENGLEVFGQGGINFRKNKLKSFDEISDAFGNGVTSIDISNNEFEDFNTFPPIIPALAFNENWLDYESKAFYRNPLNRGIGQADYGKNALERRTTQNINNFKIERNNFTKKLFKSESGTTEDMKINSYLSNTSLPASIKDNKVVQRPRASINEIKRIINIVKNIQEVNTSLPTFNIDKDATNVLEANYASDSKLNYPIIVSIRNYFAGLPEKRNTYRDAIFLLTGPNEMYAYNANTFPSYSGVNKSTGIGYAVMQPGNYIYSLGIHNGNSLKNFPALVQPSIKNKGDKIENNMIRFILTNAWKASLKNKNIQGGWSKIFEYILPKVDTSSPNKAVEQISKNIKNIFGNTFSAFFGGNAISLMDLGNTADEYIKELNKNAEYDIPRAPFIFKRDGESTPVIDTFGIVQANLHPGSGIKDTWSIGCQTIPWANRIKPGGAGENFKNDQWTDFYKKAVAAIKKRNSQLSSQSNLYDSIEYILVENPFKVPIQRSSPTSGLRSSETGLTTTYPVTANDIVFE